MSTRTLDAVYEQGVFRLLTPHEVPFADGQRVRLVVEAADSPDAILQLAGEVYAGLSAQQVAEIEQVILDRQAFFGDQASE